MMWAKFWTSGGHYIVALAVIGALAALGAVGTLSGTVVADAIISIGSAMGVGGLVAKASSTPPKPAA
jgi:hypothetical protein